MLFLSCPSELVQIVKIVRLVLQIVTIIVPIVLIVVGTFDLFKAVVASKEDEIKQAQKLLIKRVIYAVVIFLIVPIVTLIFSLVQSTNADGTSDMMNWHDCWTQAG